MKAKPIPKPELFFAVVGATGTNHDKVTSALAALLREAGYNCHLVRLSALLAEIHPPIDAQHTKFDAFTQQLMDRGDKFREESDNADAVALLGVAQIQRIRKEERQKGPSDKGVAYIVRSLKTPGEIQTLRDIYGRALYVISIFSPKLNRIENFSRLIAKSHFSDDLDKYRARATELVQRDEDGSGEAPAKYAQNVRQAFPLADLFIDESKEDEARDSLTRFVELIFGNPFHTPTRDELGAYYAEAASLRSADLSRQVGAAILDREANVLSIGCNEVPRSLGGYYWENSKPDYRDFRLGQDPSAEMKRRMFQEIFSSLVKSGWLKDDKAALSPEELAEETSRKGDGILSEVKLSHILEFGRVVHAEMAAISEAARRGVSILGSELFCTTFPCHNCARHIIASGISRIVFIEPYPKSMALHLYRHELRFEGVGCDPGTRFEPFVGIAPRAFPALFRAPERKDVTGKAIEWSLSAARPRLRRFVESYIGIEQLAIASLDRNEGGT